MGNFYTNLTVVGPSQEQVINAVKALELNAFVSQSFSGLTMVCEEKSDTQDESIWHRVAKQLSQKLICPVMAALIHDDDLFLYALYCQGKLLDDYHSCPSYWGTVKDEGPRGGNVDALVAAFGMPGEVDKVERILRPAKTFVFSSEQHIALAKALGWPDFPLARCFGYLEAGGDIDDDGESEGWQRCGE